MGGKGNSGALRTGTEHRPAFLESNLLSNVNQNLSKKILCFVLVIQLLGVDSPVTEKQPRLNSKDARLL